MLRPGLRRPSISTAKLRNFGALAPNKKGPASRSLTGSAPAALPHHVKMSIEILKPDQAPGALGAQITRCLDSATAVSMSGSPECMVLAIQQNLGRRPVVIKPDAVTQFGFIGRIGKFDRPSLNMHGLAVIVIMAQEGKSALRPLKDQNVVMTV